MITSQAARRYQQKQRRMDNPVSFLLVVATCLLQLMACDESKRTTAIDISATEKYFELLRTGHADEVERAFDPVIANDPRFRPQFEATVATIPIQNPTKVSLVWTASKCDGGVCDEGIVLEYRYPEERLLFDVVLHKQNSEISIMGIHIRVFPESTLKTYEFRFDKGPRQSAVFTLAIVLPLFIIYVLILDIRARIGRRKWIWLPFILFGVGRLTVNWTTGIFDFTLFSIQAFAVRVTPGRYSPWLLSIYFPLGAILFLIYRLLVLRRQGQKLTPWYRRKEPQSS